MVISSALIKILIDSTGTKSLDLSVPQDHITIDDSNSFVDGAGALSAEQHYSDTVTLAADGTPNAMNLFDGSLTDAFGDAIVLTKVKALYLKNNSADATLIWGNSAAGVPFLGATSLAAGGGGLIPPGGQMLLVAPDADGWAVTETTGDILTIEHDETGVATMDVDVFFLGETS